MRIRVRLYRNTSQDPPADVRAATAEPPATARTRPDRDPLPHDSPRTTTGATTLPRRPGPVRATHRMVALAPGGAGRPPDQRRPRSSPYFPVWLVTLLIATLTGAGGGWLMWPDPGPRPRQPSAPEHAVARATQFAGLATPAEASGAPRMAGAGTTDQEPDATPPPPDLSRFVTSGGPEPATSSFVTPTTPTANSAGQDPLRHELEQCQAQLGQAARPDGGARPATPARAPAKATPTRPLARKASRVRRGKTTPKPAARAEAPSPPSFWSARQGEVFLAN